MALFGAAPGLRVSRNVLLKNTVAQTGFGLYTLTLPVFRPIPFPAFQQVPPIVLLPVQPCNRPPLITWRRNPPYRRWGGFALSPMPVQLIAWHRLKKSRPNLPNLGPLLGLIPPGSFRKFHKRILWKLSQHSPQSATDNKGKQKPTNHKHNGQKTTGAHDGPGHLVPRAAVFPNAHGFILLPKLDRQMGYFLSLKPATTHPTSFRIASPARQASTMAHTRYPGRDGSPGASGTLGPSGLFNRSRNFRNRSRNFIITPR